MTILWKPQHIEQTQLHHFIEHIKRSPQISDWPSLYRWSVDHTDQFWREFLDFAELIYEGDAEPAIQPARKFQDTRFFPSLRINMAENLMRHIMNDCREGRGHTTRMLFYREDGLRRELSSAQIAVTVRRLQLALKAAGVQPGDRIAAYLPNIPETMLIMIAALSLGAVFSSSAPDFAARAVLDRFQQIRPTLLFAADAVLYRGRIVDKRAELDQIVAGLADLRRTIVVSLDNPESPFGDFIEPVPATKPVAGSTGEAPTPATIPMTLAEQDFPVFHRLPFSHPVYIMYSSGTTGLPKCMVQGPGVLLNHLKELMLHTDLKAEERIFYFTTCGWMMWNWLASSLAVGATPVLYDGHPFTPDANMLWKMAADARVNVFGTSAGYLAALERSEFDLTGLDLTSMRSILSTGSPLLPEQFDFVYGRIKSDVQLCSISGGTDLNGCFVLGNPLLPVHRGEIQCAGLGMDVDVVNEECVSQPPRKEGELICRKPFPSQPLFFWNDEDGSRYEAAYFETFPGVWRHGDFIIRTESGGFRIQGRSDATLNPGGVRIGTADLYRVVDGIPEIADSLVIGPSLKGEVSVMLFVTLRGSHTLDDELRTKIKRELKEKASPRHVPDHIFSVTEIPYTRNMKKVEIAVRNIFESRPVTNRESLANAECLDEYERLAKDF
jgi:acetoacetyl-CoA synthetase